MNSEQIISELSTVLGIDLKFSDQGTCGVFFGDDEILFEKHDEQLYLIAELAPAVDQEFVLQRLMNANYLGGECGQGTIGIDRNKDEFVLHRLIDGQIDFVQFEKILSLFVQAVRYWKEWLKEAELMQTPKLSKPVTLGGLQI
ncbi:MAG: type III secretion system chaperone [Succinivibrio sp.]|nr:type III secretion system chaperone [Succinivibrio sp.]